MNYATLERKYSEDATHGILKMYYDVREVGAETPLLQLFTVELPWENNQSRISCIQEGTYYCRPRKSVGKGDHFILEDVPGRDLILFHIGNYTRDLLGCIAPGMGFADIDRDGVIDVHNSAAAMQQLRRHGGYERNGFIIKIYENEREVARHLG